MNCRYQPAVEDEAGAIGVASDEAGAIGVASDEAGAIGVASDEAGAIGVASDEAGAIGVASEDEAGAIGVASEDEATGAAEDDGAGAASDDEVVVVTGVVVAAGRLKIQIRPMITITATMMIIQVLRFMGLALVLRRVSTGKIDVVVPDALPLPFNGQQ